MPLKTLEISEVVLLLLGTLAILALIGTTIIHLEQHQIAERESHMMGCKYLGKVQGLKDIYAFQCGQNTILKPLWCLQ